MWTAAAATSRTTDWKHAVRLDVIPCSQTTNRKSLEQINPSCNLGKGSSFHPVTLPTMWPLWSARNYCDGTWGKTREHHCSSSRQLNEGNIQDCPETFYCLCLPHNCLHKDLCVPRGAKSRCCFQSRNPSTHPCLINWVVKLCLHCDLAIWVRVHEGQAQAGVVAAPVSWGERETHQREESREQSPKGSTEQHFPSPSSSTRGGCF